MFIEFSRKASQELRSPTMKIARENLRLSFSTFICLNSGSGCAPPIH